MKNDSDAALAAFLTALGHRVREQRAKRGMTRRILARDSGVSERYLAQLESGTGNPSIALLRHVAVAMDVPLAELVTGDPSILPAHAPIMRQLHGMTAAELDHVTKAIAEIAGKTENERKKRRVALIGLRGAGKTTLGRMLAKQLDFPFIELNRVIEHEYGGSVGEILALNGQPAFRRYERRCLEQVVAQQDAMVLSTAGGIVSEPSTFAYLIENTHTIWLKAQPEEHMARVVAQGDLRPMAQNAEAMEDLKAILEAREPDYRRADRTVDTSGTSVETALARLLDVVATLTGTEIARSAVAISK